MEMHEKIPTSIIYVILAASGGMARYLTQYLQGQKFSFWKLLATISVGAFSGYMFSLFAQSMGASHTVQAMFSGVGGGMGFETVKFLYDRLKR